MMFVFNFTEWPYGLTKLSAQWSTVQFYSFGLSFVTTIFPPLKELSVLTSWVSLTPAPSWFCFQAPGESPSFPCKVSVTAEPTELRPGAATAAPASGCQTITQLRRCAVAITLSLSPGSPFGGTPKSGFLAGFSEPLPPTYAL